MKARLFYATNRKHEGGNRWSPDGYGTTFSSDGHQNLRFGELTVDYDARKASAYMAKRYKDGRVGDGEGLSDYLSKRAENANIRASRQYLHCKKPHSI